VIPVYLSKPGLVCCAGSSFANFFSAALSGDRTGIVPVEVGNMAQKFLAGRIAGTNRSGPESGFSSLSGRPGTTRLLDICAAALDQLRSLMEKALSRCGPDRIGLCLGSCDNGTELSIPAHGFFFKDHTFPHDYDLVFQSAAAPAEYSAQFFGIKGPILALATACASGATAIVRGAELIRSGICDAVIAGGADIASDTAILGFSALEAISPELSNPFSKNRRGINLGEGAAFFVLSREMIDEQAVILAGCGESSDAHHMTAPHPEGKGAAAAMNAALNDAGIKPGSIGYVNLHGTGTVLNDKAEAAAMHAVFGGNQPPASSTKPITGHTLGAAGALELALCWGVLETGAVPVHCWDGILDEELPFLNLVNCPKTGSGGSAAGLQTEKILFCMSNSFAFGGCNVSLIIGRTDFCGGK